MLLTANYLKDLFEYKDGNLYWKQKTSKKSHIKVGDEAGTVSNRYKRVSINKKLYLNHRIIFMMHHGYMPEFIDHIDNNSLNNRIENLREATFCENQHNAKLRKDNKSGVKGISWHSRFKKWSAKITVNKKVIYLGNFDDINEAKNVVELARKFTHGDFARYL